MFWGWGVLRGLGVTMKNFVASYPAAAQWLRRLGCSVDGREMFTVPYPEQRVEPAGRFRYYPFLVYDDGKDPDSELRCVACKICEQECPPQCIYIEKARDANGRPLKQPATFDIDTAICMSCQICVEVCPFDAIKMDTAFEQASYERFQSLVHTKQRLARPNSYYHQIKPAEASAVDAALLANAQGVQAARRMSGAGAESSSDGSLPRQPPAAGGPQG